MVLDNPNYKTAICKSVLENRICEYKTKCNFAHSHEEMERYNNLKRNSYKTSLCKKFHQKFFCAFGEKCHHIHYEKETGLKLKARLFEVFKDFQNFNKTRKNCFPKLIDFESRNGDSCNFI
jgi:hypothetical protein